MHIVMQGLGQKGQCRLQEGEMLSYAGRAGVQRWCQSRFTSNKPVQNTLPAWCWRFLQPHSWPSAKTPTLLLGSSIEESDASRPKRWKPATGLELLERRAVMQSFGNHQLRCSYARTAVPVVPFISLDFTGATCRLGERKNISLPETLEQQDLDILLAIKPENTVGRHLKRSLRSSSRSWAVSSLSSIPALDVWNPFLNVYGGGDAHLLQASLLLTRCFLKDLPEYSVL